MEPVSVRSYKIGVVGNWLVGWLVGNAVSSEKALRIFDFLHDVWQLLS